MTGWLTNKNFAHRGLHNPRNKIIENSLSAFKAAIDNNYGFELDVRLSKDNQAIVFHDPALKTSEKIIDLTSNQLSKIKLNDTDCIPTLKEVLNLCDGTAPILIEIKSSGRKNEELCEAVYDVIKNYNGQVAVMSFSLKVTEYFTTHYPEIICGLVAEENKPSGKRKGLSNSDFQIYIIKEQKLNFIAYDVNSLSNDVIKYCRASDIPVLTWTVRTEEDRDRANKYANNIIFEEK